eukprot:scaffold197486_cov36-Tisochrysis_lutea.AAC.1
MSCGVLMAIEAHVACHRCVVVRIFRDKGTEHLVLSLWNLAIDDSSFGHLVFERVVCAGRLGARPFKSWLEATDRMPLSADLVGVCEQRQTLVVLVVRLGDIIGAQDG